MDETMFPWSSSPDDLAERVNQMIEQWQEDSDMTTDEAARRRSGQELLRQIVHETFMAHFAATEEDFERCWPRLRDDILCGHAAQVFNHIFGLDEEEDWDDYEEDEALDDDDGFDDELEDDRGR